MIMVVLRDEVDRTRWFQGRLFTTSCFKGYNEKQQELQFLVEAAIGFWFLGGEAAVACGQFENVSG